MATISSNTNLSSLTITAGEQLDITSGATLTINSTPATRPGNIQCISRGRCLITNNSTTTPIVVTLNANTFDFVFSGNGVLEIQGQMIEIYTGNGANGQTISFASINGVSIDYPTYVEVETASGSGVYRPWYVLPTTGTTGTNLYTNLSQFATGLHGHVALYNATTQVLTFGNNTNGNVIPSGAKVRIPNIHITSGSNIDAPVARTLININPSGTLIANCVSFSNAITLALSNFKSVSLTRVGATARQISPVTTGDTVGSLSINNFIYNPDPRTVTSFVIARVGGTASIANVYALASSTTALGLQYFASLQSCQNIEGVVVGRTAATHNAVSLLGMSGQFSNLVGIGGRILIDTCSNVFVSNIQFSDQTNNTVTTGATINAVTIANSSNTVVKNFSLAGVSPPRISLFSVDGGCVNTVISNATADGASHAQDLLFAVGRNTLLANIVFNNSRTSPYVPAMSGQNLVLRNIQNNQGHTLPLAAGAFFEFVQAANIALTLPNYNDAGVFSTIVDSPRSTGKLVLGAFGSKASRDIYTISGVENTDWYFDNTGTLFVVSNSITAVFRSTSPVRSIMAFQNIAPTITGVNTGGFTIEFRISNPGAISGAAWQLLNAANLSGAIASLTGYSSNAGFDIEVRLTSVGVDAARSINQIVLPTNNDAAFAPKVGSVFTTLTNGIEGAVARLYDRTNPSSLVLLDRKTIAADGTCRLEGPYDFDGTTIPTSIRVIDYRYTRISLNAAYSNLDVSIPLSPELDSSITEINKITVDGYTHVSNLNRIRDSAKRWIELNFDLQYPSLDTGILSVDGSILDFGNLNVIITGGSSSPAFSVNTVTNDITLKINGSLESTSKFDTIKTTGTITLTNGASQGDVILIDSSGTQLPDLTTRFYGIPNVSGAILRIKDLVTNSISYPTLTSGEATVIVSPGRNYEIRADAPGYLASPIITINSTTTREYQFSLPDYRDLYDSGVSKASQISFDSNTLTITINDDNLTLNFADVFRTLEDYLSSPEGLMYNAPPYPIVLPDRNILVFPYDTIANTVNPARIKPDPTNTQDPSLTFEVFLEDASDTTYDLFDFSDAGGRIIRVRSQIAIATGSGGSGSVDLTPVLNAIDALPTAIEIENQLLDNFSNVSVDLSPIETTLENIKTKTDKLTFTVTNDLLATLDGEAVTVSSIVDNAIVANTLDNSSITKIQQGLSTASQISSLNNISTTEVRTQIDNALTAANLSVDLTPVLDAIADIPVDVETQLADNFSNVSVDLTPITTDLTAIKAKTDQLTFTIPTKVEANATVDVDVDFTPVLEAIDNKDCSGVNNPRVSGNQSNKTQ